MSEKVIVCKNMVFPEMTKIQHTLGLLGITIPVERNI